MSRSERVSSFIFSAVKELPEIFASSSFTENVMKERERTKEEKTMKSKTNEFFRYYEGGEGKGEYQRTARYLRYPRERTNKLAGAF